MDQEDNQSPPRVRPIIDPTLVDQLSIRTRITLDAPINQAWAALTDYAGFERWSDYIVRIEGAAVAGETIRVHATLPGQAKPSVQEVAVLEVAPHVMRWEGGLPDRRQFHGDHWFILTESNDCCTLDHVEYFSGTLASTILARFGEMIRANFELFNAGLKTYLEKQI